MPPDLPTGIVYHGTDAASTESIRRIGLNVDAWRASTSQDLDEKGLSITTERAIAEWWARIRAGERGGPPNGVVLEADAGLLPLRAGSPGQWTDPKEWFIAPEDFPQVGPGILY